MANIQEEFSIDIDESRSSKSGPPINLFNVDMKYQSIDFTTETSSVEQRITTRDDNSTANRSDTPPAPSLDIFDFDMKYTEDSLEEHGNATENIETVVSTGPNPQFRGFDFTSLSKSKGTENSPNQVQEKTSVVSCDDKKTFQNFDKKVNPSQSPQPSVLMQSVLQKIKTSQKGDGGQVAGRGGHQVVKREEQVTEVQITNSVQKIQETSRTVVIERTLIGKSSEDSDDEFDFDTPATKNSDKSQNLIGQRIPDESDPQVLAKKAPLASGNMDPPVNVVSVPVVISPDTKSVPAFNLSQNIPTLSNQTHAQGAAEKNIAEKFTGHTKTVTEIGHAVLQKVCENGAPSEKVPVKNNMENEWDQVQTIEAGFADENDTKKKESAVTNVPLLSFYEMSEHLGTQDFSGVKDKIRTTIEHHGFSALKNFLFGPPKLNRNLHVERDRIFCIAASVLENGDHIHVRSLQTIYRSLTGSRFDCPRYGNHWEEIGFQGRDPATDLRGVGLLGLLHLVYLLRDAKRQVLASEIYKLSLHPTQNFPFCVMSINLTRIALQALREGCLNRECNKQREVLPLMCDFYTGLYLQMYQIWKSQGKTIKDSGYVLQHVETHGKKHPHAVLKNLEEYLAKKKSGANLDNVNLGEEQFMSVVDSETAGHY
uniref:Uncharacterized protein LOC111137036 n=1 Tax=Crassostrea virginica TaxID=6565 RepID=A0A8B8EVG8_CRAVI|nr:uncharacterized protein LOC111137036 [Crassostrea virginica]